MPKIKSPTITVEYTWPHKPWRGRVIYIQWPGWKHPISIRVEPETESDYESDPKRVVETILHYKVSWSALGGVPVYLADRYIRAMKRALAEAKKLNAKYAGKGMP